MTERTRCLPPGGPLDERVRRGLEDGTITTGDADVVLAFRDYLRDVASGMPVPEAYAKHFPDDVP